MLYKFSSQKSNSKLLRRQNPESDKPSKVLLTYRISFCYHPQTQASNELMTRKQSIEDTHYSAFKENEVLMVKTKNSKLRSSSFPRSHSRIKGAYTQRQKTRKGTKQQVFHNTEVLKYSQSMITHSALSQPNVFYSSMVSSVTQHWMAGRLSTQ